MTRDERIVQALKMLGTLESGRQLVSDIREHCGYGKDVFNGTNQAQNNFNQGKQSVGNWLTKLEQKAKEQ